MNQKRKTINLSALVLGIILLVSTGCKEKAEEATAAKGLTISATTTTYGGDYAPKNVVAIWVTDNSDKFVKTLYVQAGQRIYLLEKWKSGSSSNKTDAITGATRTGHGAIMATWNGTDANKKVVADGTYKVWMEMTENEATGANTSFTFIKGAAAETKTAPNGANFTNITSSWMPL